MSDAFILSFFLIRKYTPLKNTYFEKKKLSIVIACYNGEDVIGETIKRAKKKAYAKNILIISDTSTDNTVKIAKSLGVRVFQNKRNLNKALSISSVAKKIKTPCTLIVDDDTWIDKMHIPTSLLSRKGYLAVALSVIPMKTKGLANALQIFEYRKSMLIYKRLVSDVGGVDNVSGAIGLYRTEDIVWQAKKHSGQAGGEDQQRTSFVHINSKNKGIVFYNSTAYTKAPATFKQIFKQRSYKWSRSVLENFFPYWGVVLSPKTPIILKMKKGYQIFIFLTDLIRMYLFAIALFKPIFLLQIYIFYLFFLTFLLDWK